MAHGGLVVRTFANRREAVIFTQSRGRFRLTFIGFLKILPSPTLGLDLLDNLPLLSSLLLSLDILLDRLLHPFFDVFRIVSLCQLVVLTFHFTHDYRFFAHFLAVFIE